VNEWDCNTHGLLAEDFLQQMTDHTLFRLEDTTKASALHCLVGGVNGGGMEL
jgi:hypothetical protein